MMDIGEEFVPRIVKLIQSKKGIITNPARTGLLLSETRRVVMEIGEEFCPKNCQINSRGIISNPVLAFGD